MVTVKAKLGPAEKQVARLPGAVKQAALSAVVAAADAVVDELERIAPEDTRRYIRGWQEAALAAGKGVEGSKNRTLKPLRRSGFYKYTFLVLQKQVKRYQAEVNFRRNRMKRWFPIGGKRKLTRWAKREMGKIATAVKRLTRAQEELAKAESDPGTFLLIGRGGGRKLSTVRTAVYGGTGWARVNSAGLATAVLKNNEPHASIVGNNTRVVEKATAGRLAERTMNKTFEARMRALVGTSIRAGRAIAIEA